MSEAAPPFAYDWEVLHASASALLAGRIQGYPQIVAAGKMTPADADTGIRVMAAVAARFKAALDKRPLAADAPQASPAEMVAALDHAVEATRRRARKLADELHASIRALLPILTVAELRRFHADLGGGVNRSGVHWGDPAIPPYLDALDRLAHVEALLWWARREPHGVTFFTNLTLELRARARASVRREAA